MQEYTITVFSEDSIGLLNEVTIIFSRRKINIESLTVSESEVKGVSRYTIVAFVDENDVENIVLQIEKIIGIFKAMYFEADEIVHQEVALFKIANSDKLNGNLEAFSIAKLGIDCGFKFQWMTGRMYLNVNNLWNEHYRIVEFRPMPGRNYEIGININYKKS